MPHRTHFQLLHTLNWWKEWEKHYRKSYHVAHQLTHFYDPDEQWRKMCMRNHSTVNQFRTKNNSNTKIKMSNNNNNNNNEKMKKNRTKCEWKITPQHRQLIKVSLKFNEFHSPFHCTRWMCCIGNSIIIGHVMRWIYIYYIHSPFYIY